MAIPHVIHYCWFGNNEKSELEKKCIESWRKFCPNCQIIEWNENNYDITNCEYMKEAFEAKRWGFVADYARMDIIYRYGGIYFDTDVELIRNIDELFENECFFGFERGLDTSETVFINSGQGFGASAENEIVRKMRDVYQSLHFINLDGSENLRTCPYYNTDVLVNEGMEQIDKRQIVSGAIVYPSEYFCPIDWRTKECRITDNTFSVHHFNASWLSESEKKIRAKDRKKDYIVHFPNRCLSRLLGKKKYEKIKNIIKGK